MVQRHYNPIMDAIVVISGLYFPTLVPTLPDSPNNKLDKSIDRERMEQEEQVHESLLDYNDSKQFQAEHNKNRGVQSVLVSM